MRFNIEKTSSINNSQSVDNFNSSFSKLQELRLSFEKQRDELHKVFKGELTQIFASFFQAVPKVKSVAWTQYTPYFADGDACTFRLNSINFSTTDGSDFSGYYDEDNSQDEWSGELYSIQEYLSQKENEICSQLESLLSENEEFLESVFGDHVKIVVNENGIETNEHEHD